MPFTAQTQKQLCSSLFRPNEEELDTQEEQKTVRNTVGLSGISSTEIDCIPKSIHMTLLDKLMKDRDSSNHSSAGVYHDFLLAFVTKGATEAPPLCENPTTNQSITLLVLKELMQQEKLKPVETYLNSRDLSVQRSITSSEPRWQLPFSLVLCIS